MKLLVEEDLDYVPIREQLRLAALQSYKVLDSGPERDFDRFVKEAAVRFSAPISLISLIDTDRQWFKACVGIRISETPRCISFCTHAIESDGPFVVLDAHADPRFADNPLVVGYPHIRFYAGAPLKTPSRRRIGTLNVISTRPRTDVAADDLDWLQEKASEIMQIMEGRRADDFRRRALSGQI